jgi:hypothetical protein
MPLRFLTAVPVPIGLECFCGVYRNQFLGYALKGSFQLVAARARKQCASMVPIRPDRVVAHLNAKITRLLDRERSRSHGAWNGRIEGLRRKAVGPQQFL